MKFSIALSALGLILTGPLAFSQSARPAGGYRPVSPVRVPSATVRPFGQPASTFGSNTGWGSVANPGTGHPPNTTASGLPKGSFTGYGNGYGASGQRGAGRGLRGSALYGGGLLYGYPVYVPGYADSIAANPAEFQGSYDGGGYGSDRPTVVIQNFYPSSSTVGGQAPEDPNLQTYRAPAPAPAMETPADTAVNTGNYYLIAYKNHHVYSALAYWMEGQTLHYVTTQNQHNQAALSDIDTDLTKRLNQDRNVPFTTGQ